MNEISREEALIVLRCSANDILGENASGWKNEFAEMTYKALDKAISDMEKLEKIENLLFICPTCKHLINCEDCMHNLLVKIEQIVKE